MITSAASRVDPPSGNHRLAMVWTTSSSRITSVTGGEGRGGREGARSPRRKPGTNGQHHRRGAATTVWVEEESTQDRLEGGGASCGGERFDAGARSCERFDAGARSCERFDAGA